MNQLLSLKEAVVVVASVAVLDGLWIWSNYPMYSRMYAGVQGSPMRVNAVGAALAYAFVFLSIALLVVPRLRKTPGRLWDCVREAGVLGMCVYGIYNFTNLALLRTYSWKVAIVDTIWGGVLYTAVAMILVSINRR